MKTARWKSGEFMTRTMKRGEYSIHQEFRRNGLGLNGPWTLTSQLIHEDDTVAVEISKRVVYGRMDATADEHVKKLEEARDD